MLGCWFLEFLDFFWDAPLGEKGKIKCPKIWGLPQKNQWDINGIHWYIDVYRKFRNKMNKSYKLLKPQEWNSNNMMFELLQKREVPHIYGSFHRIGSNFWTIGDRRSGQTIGVKKGLYGWVLFGRKFMDLSHSTYVIIWYYMIFMTWFLYVFVQLIRP